MKLIQLQVFKYKSIDDSTPVEINDLTCLVGKNESGKTAFLEVLNKINPIDEDILFDVTEDYPRKEMTSYKRVHDNDPAKVLIATYELEEKDLKKLEDEFGTGCISKKIFELDKYYDNDTVLSVSIDQSAVIKKYTSESQELNTDVKSKLDKISDLGEALEILKAATDSTVATELAANLEQKFPSGIEESITDFIEEMLPKFLYFSEYNTLPGAIKLSVLTGDKNKLNSGQKTFFKLLQLVLS